MYKWNHVVCVPFSFTLCLLFLKFIRTVIWISSFIPFHCCVVFLCVNTAVVYPFILLNTWVVSSLYVGIITFSSVKVKNLGWLLCSKGKCLVNLIRSCQALFSNVVSLCLIQEWMIVPGCSVSASIWYCQSFEYLSSLGVYNDVSLCLALAFPWWLMIVNGY